MMTLYYIPGAFLKNGIGNYARSDYVNSSDEFILNNVLYPRGYLDNSPVEGATKCTIQPCEFDGAEYTISEQRSGDIISWVGTPRDHDEVAALKRENAKAVVVTEIRRLESSITERMWREDAVGSTLVRDIRVLDEFGNYVEDTTNPLHGKTSSQYIAWVDAEIKKLAATLGG